MRFLVFLCFFAFICLVNAKPSWPWGWGHGATVIGPSAGHVAVIGPSDHAWGPWGYGWGPHGAVVAGPHAAPAVVAGPSGKIVVGGPHGPWW